MTKIIKVDSCEDCPYKRYSVLLYRDVCGHEDGDCWDIKPLTSIPRLCPLRDKTNRESLLEIMVRECAHVDYCGKKCLMYDRESCYGHIVDAIIREAM